jgi:hypothetical protein
MAAVQRKAVVANIQNGYRLGSLSGDARVADPQPLETAILR